MTGIKFSMVFIFLYLSSMETTSKLLKEEWDLVKFPYVLLIQQGIGSTITDIIDLLNMILESSLRDTVLG